MVIVKVDSATLDKEKRRIIKFIRYFKQDVATSIQLAPFGFDSVPPKDTKAVHEDTESVKDCVILGYINKDQRAGDGESRMYAVDENGQLKGYIWCKADGTIELTGAADNVVRFIPLDAALQNLVSQLQAELVKIQAGIIAGGGSYTPGTLSIDIADAKVDELKTP